MKRRTLLQSGAALLAWPSALLAQNAKQFRVGFLLATDEAVGKPFVGPRALRAKTSAIPIVLWASTDPVAAGLVKSLARPGTNVTGLSSRIDQLIAKQIEILSEISPRMSRVALLLGDTTGDDDGTAIAARWEAFAKAAAAGKGLSLIVVRARVDPAGFRQAFAEIEKRRSNGIVVSSFFTFTQYLQEITGHVRRLRLPSISHLSTWPRAGGLAYYGAHPPSGRRSTARFIDRILKGAKPAELPVEHPEVSSSWSISRRRRRSASRSRSRSCCAPTG